MEKSSREPDSIVEASQSPLNDSDEKTKRPTVKGFFHGFFRILITLVEVFLFLLIILGIITVANGDDFGYGLIIVSSTAFVAILIIRLVGKQERKRIAQGLPKAEYNIPFEIDYVVIAGSESRTKAGSAISRGVVGGALLGPVGLLAAAGAKKDSHVTLVVHYKSGRVKTVKVKLGTSEFNKYAKYIR